MKLVKHMSPFQPFQVAEPTKRRLGMDVAQGSEKMDEDNQHLGSTLTDPDDVRQNFLLSFRLLSFFSLFSKSCTYRFDGVRVVSTRCINCCLDTTRGLPER
ncbi:hypothetical protein GOODEAATRI_027399 [Goodea atripinnis]|uniref:Uncharacterized protein n=1 Tax=Goodea atripinnis TaxID=208336 RepID=A0ABV0P875_9TELE